MPPIPVKLTARRAPEPGMPVPMDEMTPSTCPLHVSPPLTHGLPTLVASLSHERHSMPVNQGCEIRQYAVRVHGTRDSCLDS